MSRHLKNLSLGLLFASMAENPVLATNADRAIALGWMGKPILWAPIERMNEKRVMFDVSMLLEVA